MPYYAIGFLLLFISTIIASIYTNSRVVFTFTLPFFCLLLALWNSSLWYLQIPLILIWMLLVFKPAWISFYAREAIKLPRWLSIIETTLCATAAVLAFYFYLQSEDFTFPSFEMLLLPLISFAAFMICKVLIDSFLYYLIAPYFTTHHKEIISPLSNYIAYYSRRSSSYYINFRDDPIQYQVSYQQYRKFRKKIGTVYSYQKYKAVFNSYYVKQVKLIDDSIQEMSTQDILALEKRQAGTHPALLVLIIILVTTILTTIILFMWIFIR